MFFPDQSGRNANSNFAIRYIAHHDCIGTNLGVRTDVYRPKNLCPRTEYRTVPHSGVTFTRLS